jgi:hypothetical protein
MLKDSSSERRKVQRLSISIELECSDGHGFFTGLILDLSPGGLQIEVPRACDTGTTLLLSLSFKPALKLKGLVRWVKKKGLSYRIGVQFLDLTSDQESVLRAINQSIMWQTLKR